MDAGSPEIVEKLRCRLPGATGCSPGCRGLESGIQTRTFGDQDSARAESATPAEGRCGADDSNDQLLRAGPA